MSCPPPVDVPTIFLTTNTGQLFTELYFTYSLLAPPPVTVVEESLYLRFALPGDPSTAPDFSIYAADVLNKFLTNEKTIELYINPILTPSPAAFFPCSGATQLFAGLVYAIVNVNVNPERKYIFVEKIPYFNSHQVAVTTLFPPGSPLAEFRGFRHPSEIVLKPNEVLVEYVTSPNNPDGKCRKPYTNANIIIADFVFSSPFYGPADINDRGFVKKNIKWLQDARAASKVIYSFDSASKHFGKAGDRWGYFWIPRNGPGDNFLPIFNTFTSIAGGVSSVAGTNYLDLITEVSKKSEMERQALYDDFNFSLQKRFELVAYELLARYPGSTVVTEPGSPTFFIKIEDKRLPPMTGQQIIFLDTLTDVNAGSIYGEDDPDNAYVRLNLCGTSTDLVEFLNRLACQTKPPKYVPSDVFFSSVNICSVNTITCQQIKGNNEYIVNPNDCRINVDATEHDVVIILPLFIDYEFSKIVTIKRFDCCESHSVTIKSPTFTVPLYGGNKIKVQWDNPFFSPGAPDFGKWVILS
ncbi:MAG: LL-diaminopimelate aminotransferase [Hyperionvirus sp.]|uniref:LL-diaminopimelate aminotransferase n=1 Tax=Hyperionvirus sp. TaxID=2487770 RepID=A0A3G5A821_9VIRU|nr:MAG: LL-diaminopimelate aminotransferase [Hyperionvirus sp.]